MQSFPVLLFLLIVSLPFTAAAEEADKRPFTVRDAIELNALHEQRWKEISVAPSGDNFFIVTSHGNIKANTREFRLEIYGVSDVRKYLKHGTSDLKPVQVMTLVTSSNNDAISDARWDPDGKSVLFLGAEGDNSYQVYRYDLPGKKLEKLTNSPLDVIAFDHRADITIYAARTNDGVPDYREIPSLTITDESLPTLIFPEEMFERHEYAAFLVHAGTSEPVRLLKSKRNAPYIYDFSISPDGRYAAAILPAREFPEQWRRYQAPANEGSNAGVEQRGFQFQLIDLKTTESKPLIDAPVSWVVWSRNKPMAVWSDDGSTLLMTSTMAPLRDDGDDHKRLSLPVVAIQEFENGKPVAQSVIPFFDDLPSSETLVDAKWIEASESYQLYTAGGRTPETYGKRVVRKMYDIRRDGGSWKVDEGVVVETSGSPALDGLDLSVVEDANTPPGLWVSNNETGQYTKLRELNPQLSAVALSQVNSFEWKDKNGKSWSGALVLPEDRSERERLPVVIELKFASPSKFRPDGPYTTAFATQALAAKGIAVLEVNAFDPETMNSEQEALTQLNGIEGAIKYLDEQGIIDTTRVGLIGFSRTAYYVKYALTQSDFEFAAAALSDGVDAGYVQYIVFGVNYYDGAAAEDYATLNGALPYGDGLKAWLDSAPGFNLDKVRTPLRIEAIGKSSALQEWEFFSGLKMLGKTVELNYIPHGAHILVKPQERLASQQGNVDWFGYWLLGNLPDESRSTDPKAWLSNKSIKEPIPRSN